VRYINVRQFIRNLPEEIQNLPVTVTRYGRPIFTATFEGDHRAVPEEMHDKMIIEKCSIGLCTREAEGMREGKPYCKKHL